MAPRITEEGLDCDENGEQHDEPSRPAKWSSLFNFTARNHAGCLAIAIMLSIISGVVVPTVAVLLGRTFNKFTDFGAGRLAGRELVRGVSMNCVALVAVGAGGWALNGGYFMFWLVFGELQAQNVRSKLFDGLMQKDREWYDLRKNGVSALIPRIQRYGSLQLTLRSLERLTELAKSETSKWQLHNLLDTSSSTW